MVGTRRASARQAAAAAATDSSPQPSATKKRGGTKKEQREKTREPTPPPKEPTPPPKPPVITLPTKILDNQPLPSLPHRQPRRLKDSEWQSIADSGVLAASLARSRNRWMQEDLFETYWSKATYKKKKELMEQNKPITITKGQRPPMTKVGTCKMIVEPHIFDTTLYIVKDPAPPLPPKSLSTAVPANNNNGGAQFVSYGPGPGQYQGHGPATPGYQQPVGYQPPKPYTPVSGSKPPLQPAPPAVLPKPPTPGSTVSSQPYTTGAPPPFTPAAPRPVTAAITSQGSVPGTPIPVTHSTTQVRPATPLPPSAAVPRVPEVAKPGSVQPRPKPTAVKMAKPPAPPSTQPRPPPRQPIPPSVSHTPSANPAPGRVYATPPTQSVGKPPPPSTAQPRPQVQNQSSGQQQPAKPSHANTWTNTQRPMSTPTTHHAYPRPRQSDPPKPAPGSGTDPVIQMLAQRAGTDPALKQVMKIVADGRATPAELAYFQRHIDELNKIVKDRQAAEKRQRAAEQAAANRQAAANKAQPYQQPYQGPGSRPPNTPAPGPATPGSVPPVPHTPTTAPPYPQAASKAPNNYYTPQPRPSMQPIHQPRPAYHHHPPPPKPPRQVFIPPPLHVLMEFHQNSTDRFVFPKHSIVEMSPDGKSLTASFLVVKTAAQIEQSNLHPEGTKYKRAPKKKKEAPDASATPVVGVVSPTPTGDAPARPAPAAPASDTQSAASVATPPIKTEAPAPAPAPTAKVAEKPGDKQYYQTVTVRLDSPSDATLFSYIVKMVAPVEEVQKYMRDVASKAERIPTATLALRLPREEREVLVGDQMDTAAG